MDLSGKVIDFSTPKIMGILNVTPDSFYDGGAFNEIEDVINRSEVLVEEGVDIIDIGGYSTRPGALEVGVEEELNRVVPVVEKLSKLFPNIILSVDTFRQTVAQASINAGADIINDVSAGSLDKNMLPWILKSNIPYVAMHMRGNPSTMQDFVEYNDVTEEVKNELAMKFKDFPPDFPLIFDPGFGFSKTLKQNYKLLNELERFTDLNRPLLVGVSRKSMIYKKLNSTPKESLNGTSVLNTIALMKGAKILRVHDLSLIHI